MIYFLFPNLQKDSKYVINFIFQHYFNLFQTFYLFIDLINYFQHFIIFFTKHYYLFFYYFLNHCIKNILYMLSIL